MEGEPSTAGSRMAIYQLSLYGGVPRLLIPLNGMVQFGCTKRAANFCVYERAAAGRNQLVVTSFDASSGREKELRRIPLERGGSAEVGFDYAWQISPEGQEIAVLRRHTNQIRLVPVNGSPERIINVHGYSDIRDLFWDAGARGLTASASLPGGSTLLRIDFDGNTRPLWRGPQRDPARAVMSPDGRHLAISAESVEANVWMVDHF